MPDVEVDRPHRQRDGRVGEHAQAVERTDAQHRRQQRAGEAQHDQQRPDVGHQQVLGHVGRQQLAGDVPERREQDDDDQRDAGVEGELTAAGTGRPSRASSRARSA